MGCLKLGELKMELKEFYDKIDGDYEGTISRLMKDEIIKKFVIKFLNDKSYEELKSNLESSNMEDAFRSAHTLKGVASNLGMTKLYTVGSEITETLRHKEYDGVDVMFEAVEKEYIKTIELIKQL